ncbi:MAG: hypothetical protein ABI534_05725 [Chloroflexota bacterium]
MTAEPRAEPRVQPRRGWLRHAARAGQIVSDRADLWLAGALAWLAYGGVLIFLAAVVPFPSLADLAFFSADIAVSGSILPAVLLGAGLLAAFIVLCVLHAVGASVVIGELDGRRGWFGAATELLAVHLVASVPVAAAGLFLSWRLAIVAPAEYQSPDIGGPLALRIAAGVLPELLLVLLVLLVVQVMTAGASWRVAGWGRIALAIALRGGLTDARRHPLRLGGIAVATFAVHLAYGAIAFLLLRLLYAPIGAALAEGQVRDVGMIALLVGFVAIWLCLVLGGGALHAWASAWWAGELEAGTHRHEGAGL